MVTLCPLREYLLKFKVYIYNQSKQVKIMETKLSIKFALSKARAVVGEIHPTPNSNYYFYAPFDMANPIGPTTPVKSLAFREALIKRKIELVCQALWFLGYNKGYIDTARTTLDYSSMCACELPERVDQLVSEYHIGLTVDNARK